MLQINEKGISGEVAFCVSGFNEVVWVGYWYCKSNKKKMHQHVKVSSLECGGNGSSVNF